MDICLIMKSLGRRRKRMMSMRIKRQVRRIVGDRVDCRRLEEMMMKRRPKEDMLTSINQEERLFSSWRRVAQSIKEV